MEAIKFIAMYGLEITVVALVGVTLIAGLYQLIRDQVRARTASRSTPVQEPVKRS